MSHKTKKTVQKKLTKKLYTLLLTAATLSETERDFWLANYQTLPSIAQTKLFTIVEESEKELAHENDAHLGRIAEIDAKCLSQLQELQKADKNLVNCPHASVEANEEDFDEEEIFAALRAAGEI